MGDLHPNKYGDPISNTVTTTGRNRNDGSYPEAGFLRCKKCGQIMNKFKHHKGIGEGRVQPNTQLNGAVTAGDATINVDSTSGFNTPQTGSITAFSAFGGGTKVTSASHGLKGGKVVISSTTNYDGTFYIQDVLPNSFVIQKPYTEDDATGTWTVPDYILIYDAGTYATDEDVSSTYTDTEYAPTANRVSYTGLTVTTFTGCEGATSHDDNMYVRGMVRGAGCPFCYTFNYEA
jgi:hypothetical protein